MIFWGLISMAVLNPLISHDARITISSCIHNFPEIFYAMFWETIRLKIVIRPGIQRFDSLVLVVNDRHNMTYFNVSSMNLNGQKIYDLIRGAKLDSPL